MTSDGCKRAQTLSIEQQHMKTLHATRPNDTVSVVSQPVGDACQWAAAEIARLQAALGEIQGARSLKQCVTVASTALSHTLA